MRPFFLLASLVLIVVGANALLGKTAVADNRVSTPGDASASSPRSPAESTPTPAQAKAGKKGSQTLLAATVTPTGSAGTVTSTATSTPTGGPSQTPTKTRTPFRFVSTPTRTSTPLPPTSTPVSKASGAIVIDSRSNVVIENLVITSSTGPCVVIKNSQNVTLRASEIGKCKGNGVEVSSSTNVSIVDNYIHPEFMVSTCCDKGDGIYAHSSSGLLVQGNVIAYGETNIELQGVTSSSVIGNFLVNPSGPFPRGQQVQVWGRGNTRSADIRIESNYALSSTDAVFAHPEAQWDAINLGFTEGAVVKANYIQGGHSTSGCGLIADEAANEMQFLDNVLVETGQCAIGIASGRNQVVSGNRAYGHGVNSPNVGNTSIYVWNQYAAACGPVRVSNNTAVLIRPNGSYSSYWKGSGCDSTTVTGNIWDSAARNTLSPIEDNMTPPTSLPPVPYALKVSNALTIR